MPSPDLSPFIDLSLNDETAQTLYEASQDNFLANVPDWIPREANIEVLLMEALSVQIAELIYSINRVPNSVVEGLVALQGLERDAGAPPTTTLTFTMVDDAGYAIPPGTSVLVESGESQMTFVTTALYTVPVGSTSGTISAVGSIYTSDMNGITSADCFLVNSLIYIDEVVLGSAIVNGADAETDANYFARATALFQRMTTTLILPSHFTSYALSNNVYRATTIDNWDPDDSGSVPGSSGGHVTVVVYGTNAVLSAPTKAALQAGMDASSAANLVVHVVDAVVKTVNVAVTVKALPDWATEDVQANVTAALSSYLSIDTWDWSSTLFRNNLIAVISYAEGVSYVSTLTTPSTDLVWTTYGNLAKLGTCTVTVI